MTNAILLYNPFPTSNVESATAAGAITPGHVLTYASATTVVAAATAAAVGEKIFADFNPHLNPSGTKAIDVAYASADTVYLLRPSTGAVVYAWLDAGGTATFGSNLVIGTTDGTLLPATVDANTLEGALIARAEEAVTAGTVPARIKVRVY